jgi:transcriptional regulator with XRE-family HTH domain
MNIGQKLKNLREYNNYTQKYVADYLNVSQKTLSNMENSGNDILFSTIEKLAKLYNVTVNQVLELNVDFILNNHHQSGGIGGINNLNFQDNLVNGVQENTKNIQELIERLGQIEKSLNQKLKSD